MQAEIVFLSPFRGFTHLIKDVCHEVGEDGVEVLETYGGECGSLAAELAPLGCKAIIGKEFSAASLVGRVDLPIIPLHVGAYDVLQNMFLASKSYRKIAYIGFWKEASRYNFKSFAEVLGVTVEAFLYQDITDVEPQVYQALEAGSEIILTTGACVARKARSLNIPARVIYPSREAVLEAIGRGREIIAIRERDAKYSQQLSTIINSVSDGIIMVDVDKGIKVINHSAREMLDPDSTELPHELLGEAANSQAGSLLVQVGNRQLLVTHQPVTMEGEETGTLITFRDISEVQRLEQQIRREIVKKGLAAKFTFDDMIGKSQVFQHTVAKARRYAESDSAVLITGESGTAKELFAQSIHNASNWKNGPFVGINCAALPESLLDSELFGYEKGSFTGAEKAGKAGLFELAHNGTIFLDEIADLPFALQAKLLRVLQEKEVRRIGGDKIVPINVRVIAATNKNLAKEVEEGRFRTDLYYRLNVLRLNIPPLRVRKDDIELLAVHFLNRQATRERRHVPQIGPEVLAKLSTPIFKYGDV